jgi:hypothetical protein
MIPEKQNFYINIKVINNNMTTIYLGINKNINSTIYDIKYGLYNETGIHPNHQRIILEGKEQDNNIFLEGLKLETKNCLHMVVLRPYNF